MLWGAVQRLTREQLGCGIIALCAALQEQVAPYIPFQTQIIQCWAGRPLWLEALVP